MTGAAEKRAARVIADNVESIRTPPFSMEAEQAVLGSAMLDASALSKVADVVSPEDFYRSDHRLIFRAMLDQDSKDRGIDAVTLAEYLQARHELDQAGGLAYLATIARDTPTAANCRTYAEIVRDHSVRRQLISAGSEIAENGYRSRTDLRETLDEAQRLVMNLGENRHDTGPSPITDSLGRWHDSMTLRSEAADGILGLRTGLARLDEFTCGMEAGDLWIVAGRPGMGKTNLALSVAANLSIRDKKCGLMFSLEMNTEQLISRLVSNLGRVNLDSIRRAQMDESQWKRSTDATGQMHGSRLLIDDTAGLSVMEMRARARRVKQRHGLAYIIVDHLQLVRARAENRTQEITQITGALKALAKSLKVPVIALSQLNRGVEQRQNRRPNMSDLRESGSIEQDADVIVFIYRDAKYHHNSQFPNIAEAIIAKQRNGPIDTLLLGYDGAHSCFENPDPEAARDYRAVEHVSHETSRSRGGFEPDADRRFPDP